MSELGLVQVYTGEGKGKSTAAFGLALRAWGRGLRVCIIQFMKLGEDYGEVQAVRRLAGVDIFQFGGEHFVRKGSHRPLDVDRAREGLAKARQAISSRGYDLVILDEVNVATDFGLLRAEEVLEVIHSRDGVEVVLTGRNAPREFLQAADLVTEMRMVKHPYDRGVQARPGIEY